MGDLPPFAQDTTMDQKPKKKLQRRSFTGTLKSRCFFVRSMHLQEQNLLLQVLSSTRPQDTTLNQNALNKMPVFFLTGTLKHFQFFP